MKQYNYSILIASVALTFLAGCGTTSGARSEASNASSSGELSKEQMQQSQAQLAKTNKQLSGILDNAKNKKGMIDISTFQTAIHSGIKGVKSLPDDGYNEVKIITEPDDDDG